MIPLLIKTRIVFAAISGLCDVDFGQLLQHASCAITHGLRMDVSLVMDYNMGYVVVTYLIMDHVAIIMWFLLKNVNITQICKREDIEQKILGQ